VWGWVFTTLDSHRFGHVFDEHTHDRQTSQLKFHIGDVSAEPLDRHQCSHHQWQCCWDGCNHTCLPTEADFARLASKETVVNPNKHVFDHKCHTRQQLKANHPSTHRPKHPQHPVTHTPTHRPIPEEHMNECVAIPRNESTEPCTHIHAKVLSIRHGLVLKCAHLRTRLVIMSDHAMRNKPTIQTNKQTNKQPQLIPTHTYKHKHTVGVMFLLCFCVCAPHVCPQSILSC
jgi:hypothetical protein